MSDTKHPYEELNEFRSSKLRQLFDQRVSVSDFIHGSFNFLKQNKLKPIVKAHKRNDVLFNYMYWTIQIERRVEIERELIEYELGNVQLLLQASEVYAKRRDQMVRRLLWELEEEIKECYIIFDNIVEIVLKDGIILHCSKDCLYKVRVAVSQINESKIPYYLPAIKLAP